MRGDAARARRTCVIDGASKRPLSASCRSTAARWPGQDGVENTCEDGHVERSAIVCRPRLVAGRPPRRRVRMSVRVSATSATAAGALCRTRSRADTGKPSGRRQGSLSVRAVGAMTVRGGSAHGRPGGGRLRGGGVLAEEDGAVRLGGSAASAGRDGSAVGGGVRRGVGGPATAEGYRAIEATRSDTTKCARAVSLTCT